MIVLYDEELSHDEVRRFAEDNGWTEDAPDTYSEYAKILVLRYIKTGALDEL